MNTKGQIDTDVTVLTVLTDPSFSFQISHPNQNHHRSIRNKLQHRSNGPTWQLQNIDSAETECTSSRQYMEPYEYKTSKTGHSIGHSIGHRAKHSKFKRIKITSNISSDHSGIEPKTKGKTYVNDTWRLNNTPFIM